MFVEVMLLKSMMYVERKSVSTPVVVVVPPQALLAPAALLRLAVLGSAEKCNALPVFAFVHFSDSIYNHPP